MENKILAMSLVVDVVTESFGDIEITVTESCN
jgi:hypothetical protein